jgi:hypothetical protein
MSSPDSMEMLFERAKGKLTIKDWEALFNDVCDSITGKKFSFGNIRQLEGDANKFFSFEDAVDRANSAVMMNVNLATLNAKAETILLIKERLGKITPAEAQKEREELQNLATQFKGERSK